MNQNIKWAIDEINILVFILLYYMELHSKSYDMLEDEDWDFISNLLLRESKECEMKWNCLMKSRSNKKSWTFEEDQLLFKIIK